MPDVDKKERAISAFESGDYRGAFLSFIEIYNAGAGEEREMILQTLEEGYYRPNEEALLANYRENCALLAAYPYQWGFRNLPAEALPVRVFPVTETEYSLFDKKERTFSGLLEIDGGELRDYLFRDLSRPVFRENECSLYHLRYLEDNVRRSEDYGGDNHIYLYYDGMAELAPLLFLGELKPLLEQKKPVFLIGENNRKRYPVDFKKKFQIDYASMGPNPVRIEEVKRMCFWYKHAHSGSSVSQETLKTLDEVQMLQGHDFNAYSKIDGTWILKTETFLKAVADVNAVYTADQIAETVQSEKYEIVLDGLEDFLDWLRRHRPAPHAYTVKELFCGYALFLYEKRGLNPRVAPMILYDPHTWNPSCYSNIVLSFPYHTVLTCVREPIMTFIRCQQVGIVGWEEFSTKYMLAFDYAHAQFLHKDLLPCYYGYRFEDLKTKPEIVCRAMCRHLNLPFSKSMLEIDLPHSKKGCRAKEGEEVAVRGFSTAPLHWDLSACLSDFDRIRLQMFYAPILQYYGYPTFPFQQHPLSEDLVRELFKYPFRFELVNPRLYADPPDPDTLHAWVQETLQNAWRKNFISPKLIPLEEQAAE